MALTAQQLADLKVDIDADPVFSILPNTPDDNQTIADAYNNDLEAPAFYVLEDNVEVDQIISGIDMAEYVDEAKVTPAQRAGFDLLMRNGTYNPEPPDARTALSVIFTGLATNSRDGILGVSVKQATRLEKLYAVATTGPGGGNGSTSTQSAIRAFKGTLGHQDVTDARNLP